MNSLMSAYVKSQNMYLRFFKYASCAFLLLLHLTDSLKCSIAETYTVILVVALLAWSVWTEHLVFHKHSKYHFIILLHNLEFFVPCDQQCFSFHGGTFCFQSVVRNTCIIFSGNARKKFLTSAHDQDGTLVPSWLS